MAQRELAPRAHHTELNDDQTGNLDQSLGESIQDANERLGNRELIGLMKSLTKEIEDARKIRANPLEEEDLPVIDDYIALLEEVKALAQEAETLEVTYLKTCLTVWVSLKDVIRREGNSWITNVGIAAKIAGCAMLALIVMGLIKSYYNPFAAIVAGIVALISSLGIVYFFSKDNNKISIQNRMMKLESLKKEIERSLKTYEELVEKDSLLQFKRLLEKPRQWLGHTTEIKRVLVQWLFNLNVVDNPMEYIIDVIDASCGAKLQDVNYIPL